MTLKFPQNVVLGLNINIGQKSGKTYFWRFLAFWRDCAILPFIIWAPLFKITRNLQVIFLGTWSIGWTRTVVFEVCFDFQSNFGPKIGQILFLGILLVTIVMRKLLVFPISINMMILWYKFQISTCKYLVFPHRRKLMVFRSRFPHLAPKLFMH